MKDEDCVSERLSLPSLGNDAAARIDNSKKRDLAAETYQHEMNANAYSKLDAKSSR